MIGVIVSTIDIIVPFFIGPNIERAKRLEIINLFGRVAEGSIMLGLIISWILFERALYKNYKMQFYAHKSSIRT